MAVTGFTMTGAGHPLVSHPVRTRAVEVSGSGLRFGLRVEQCLLRPTTGVLGKSLPRLQAAEHASQGGSHEKWVAAGMHGFGGHEKSSVAERDG
jgi:hypothetical protein